MTSYIDFDFNVVGETYPDKDITSDTIWTKNQGPYIINQGIIVSSETKLTIEAGTEIIFLTNGTLAIKGILNVEGEENEPVIFKLHHSIDKENGPERCILIKNEIEVSIEIKFAKFYDFHSAIYVRPAGADVLIRGSEFRNHYTAVTNWGGSAMILENCVFENNSYSIHGSKIEVHNSFFKNNDYGLYEVENSKVYNSIFTKNDISINGEIKELKTCKISENNIGIQATGEICNNHIVNNNIGLWLSGGETKINYNNIFDNNEYNIKSHSYEDIDATNNWWGTTNKELIDQSIYAPEIDDGNIMGEIIYEPFLKSEIIDFSEKDDDSDDNNKSTSGFLGIYLILSLIGRIFYLKRKKII
jgi:hypothetical protein